MRETELDGAQPPRVRVFVLGPTRALVDDVPVALGGPRQRAVLARLAIAPGVAVTDDRLIDDLWGDAAPRSVTVTLQGYVSGLRRALGDPSIIVRRGTGYVLDLPPECVDAVALERRAAEVERQAAAGQRTTELDELVTRIGAARAEWGGEPWADHLGDPWTLAPAAAATAARRRIDRVLVETLLRLGRPAAALSELAASRERDPLDEELAAAEMTALYQLGRQADALAVADSLRERLLDELGLDPSPRITELSLAILRHELGGPTAPASGERRPLPRPTLPERVLRTARRPFVGRVEPLGRLSDAALGPTDGPRLVVVRGEPGIGKTALVATMVGATTGNRPIVWTRCHDDTVIPRHTLHELATSVLRTPDGRVDGALLQGREHLSRLLPELAVAAGELPPATPVEQWEIAEALASLLHELSAADGLVIVIDDVHWIDPSSASVLSGLLRDGHLDRVVLVATRRSTGAEPNAALDDLLVAAHRFGSVVEIDLGGLTLEETAALVGPGSTAAATRELHERTKGHPLHLGALAGHTGAGLPPSLRDLFGARLDALDPASLAVVRAVAVLGSSATLVTVAAMCRLDLDATVEALDSTIRAGLVVEGGGEAAVDTVHALVRDAVLAHAGNLRVASLHLRAADALADVGAAPPEVAHHLLAAGSSVPRARRSRAALDAARHALRQFAYAEAMRWCRLADHPEAPPALRAEIATTESLALRSAGLGDQAREAARRGIECARAANDPILFAEAVNMLAIAHGGLGFTFDGMDEEIDLALADAIAWLPGDARRLRSRLLSFRVANGVMDHDRALLQAWSAEAIELTDPVADPRTLTVALLADRLAHWTPDGLPHRLARSVEAVAAARRSPSLLSAATAQVYLVADLLEAGHPAESFAAWRDLRRLARRLRQPLYDSFVLFFEATFALLRGHAEHATRLSGLGLTRALESHGANGDLAFAAQTFLAARDRGSLGGLTPLVRDAVEQFPDLGVWRAGLAVASLAGGDREGAAAALATVVHLDGTVDLRVDSMWTLGVALAAEAAAELGDSERATITADSLAPASGRWVVGGLGGAVLGPVDLPRARALTAADRLDEALAAIDAAVASCEVGARVPLARSLHARADVLDRLGAADRAEADRRRATAIADRVGLALPPRLPR